MDLREQMEQNQTIEKSALIVAGTTLISTGVACIADPQKMWAGVFLSVLGIVCLIAREVIKLKTQ